MSQFSGIVPCPFTPEHVPQVWQQVVVVRWLEQEIEVRPERRLPALAILTRWRNREVRNFVHDNMPLYEMRACIKLYGNMPEMRGVY